jgi:prepilin-type processing-associated H-X9-DG protein
MYADENDNKIVCGNTHRGIQFAWVYWEDTLSTAQKLQGLKDGYLFSYCPDTRLYMCPAGVRGEVVTYAVVDYMNGHDAIAGATPAPLKNRTQIRNSSTQIVFLDEGRLSPSSWTVYYYQERWWDKITARHGNGTNLAFADGHSEYWKWDDPRTIKIGKSDYGATLSPAVDDMYWSRGNQDLRRVQMGTWSGKLGYTEAN